MATALIEEKSGKVVIRNIGLLLSGDIDHPILEADTIVIHGDQDSTVPLANVLDWAGNQNLPVTLIPGADHFFQDLTASIT